MSREYQGLLDAMQQNLFGPGLGLEEARERLEGVHGHPISGDVQVEWSTLGGVRCAWVDTPESGSGQRILLLCHGGAYIAAGGDGYLFYAEMLARACGMRVLLVDYRLAPAHRHPAALEDCAAAYRGLIDGDLRPEQIAVIGDSCGGGLAVGALVQLRRLGIAMPACAVTLGGWFDLEASGESATHPAGREIFASPEFTRARGRDYVGPDGDLRDPLASPIHADLAGLPPLLLQSGQVDLTRSDAITLADHAGRSGVDVTVEIHPGMIHGFQGLARAGIPEAIHSLTRVSRFLDSRIPPARDESEPTDAA
jgi:monoterpene epsilon-lactone hydrolase